MTYPATTSGWSPTELRTTTRRVLLQHGTNTITFGKGTGYAELDDIDVRPDQHRYEAEYAAVTDAHKSAFGYDALPDYVGGIDNADSAVDFAVDAPVAGNYTLSIGYANATGTVSTHTVTVNGQSQGTVTYQPTTAWLGTAAQDQVEKLTTVPVTLTGGVHHIVLGKGTGHAELDYVTLGVPVASDTPAGVTALSNPNSGRCLDVAGGTPAVQAPCVAGSTAQEWQPVDLGSGVTLLNAATGEALDIGGCATQAGAAAQEWHSLDNACQTFVYQSSTPQGRSLVGQGSGRCLDVQNSGTADGRCSSTTAPARGTGSGSRSRPIRRAAGASTPTTKGRPTALCCKSGTAIRVGLRPTRSGA